MFCPTGRIHQSRHFKRPLFARLGRDIAFLDERHILVVALAADSSLRPGEICGLMLLVYEFEKSAVPSVTQQVVTYCFHIVPPVRAGLSLFYHARIGANTASFSPPTNSNSDSPPRGYFYADPNDRIITLEVSNNNWAEETELMAELYVPVRTFLAYIAAHPAAAESARTHAGACSGPYVDVPWEDWGPCGAHLVRSPDQTYIIRRQRTCGMRVLGASLSSKSVVVTDYHPGRVARSAAASVGVSADGGAAAAARVRARALDLAAGTSLSSMRRRCFPPVVRVTKEVPLPPELQKASESPWTMLCEDALLAFQVSSLGTSIIYASSLSEWMMRDCFAQLGCTQYVPEGFEISRVFAYTF